MWKMFLLYDIVIELIQVDVISLVNFFQIVTLFSVEHS